MRITIGAAAFAAVLLIAVFDAPPLPVILGAAGAAAILVWRRGRRGHGT